MIRLAAILQLVWAIGLFALMGLPNSPWFKADSIWPYFSYAILATAVGPFCNLRFGWYSTICLNLSMLVLVGGMFAINVLMFIIGHELYRDSPGTIIVVFIYAIILVAPPATICGLLYADRAALKESLRLKTGSRA
jgi:hypothetical protein